MLSDLLMINFRQLIIICKNSHKFFGKKEKGGENAKNLHHKNVESFPTILVCVRAKLIVLLRKCLYTYYIIFYFISIFPKECLHNV